MSNAQIFRSLHSNPEKPLILANVWDAAGARIVESLGGQAVGTTSGGVAWALGYPDGDRVPPAKLAALAENIVGTVKIPVSFDVEGGYSDNPATVAEFLKPIFAAGVVGINIEDGADSPSLLAKKIEAIREVASSMELDIFVNARTDVYLADLVADDLKVVEVLKRANAYQEAGADGLFVPCLVDSVEMSRITSEIKLPINIMAMPGLPKASDLAKLNVRRLSAGTGLAKLAWSGFAQAASKFLEEGDSMVLTGESMSYGDLQKLFAGRK